MNSILSKTAATEYTFCPHCGVDVTIFSHEDDCPCVRHNNKHQSNDPSSSLITTATRK
jgi:hypothetical protein